MYHTGNQEFDQYLDDLKARRVEAALRENAMIDDPLPEDEIMAIVRRSIEAAAELFLMLSEQGQEAFLARCALSAPEASLFDQAALVLDWGLKEEVARMTGRSTGTILNWLRAGGMPDETKAAFVVGLGDRQIHSDRGALVNLFHVETVLEWGKSRPRR